MAFPKYSFADQLKTPAQLDITKGGSFDQIGNAIAGVNYYMDSIAFGESTGFAKTWGNRQFSQQKPLGIRFFTKTGRTCDNGEPMYAYVSSIPKGNILGERIKNEIKGVGLPQLRGLALGAMEDARDALNPNPFFKIMGAESINPKCVKKRRVVGDAEGRLANPNDSKNVWVTGETQPNSKGMPTQEFWIEDGIEEDIDTELEEGFKGKQEPQFTYPWIAGVLLGVLAIGILSLKQK